MENWQLHREAYEQLGRPGDKAHEDLVARRIVRGIGFANAEKALYNLEMRVLGEKCGEDPMLVRALRLFRVLLRMSADWAYLVADERHRENPRAWDIQALQLDKRGGVAERFETEAWVPAGVPLLLTRIGDTKESLAYTLWEHDRLGYLTPPFAVLPCRLSNPVWRLVEQPTEAFVRQFGPFRLEAI